MATSNLVSPTLNGDDLGLDHVHFSKILEEISVNTTDITICEDEVAYLGTLNDCLYYCMDRIGAYVSSDSIFCDHATTSIQYLLAYNLQVIPTLNGFAKYILQTGVRYISYYATLLRKPDESEYNSMPGIPLYDTANWIKIPGRFLANGGERHLVISNFFNFISTSWYWIQQIGYPRTYYFIGDVSHYLEVALQTPYEGGNAVYTARLMLNIEPEDYGVPYQAPFNANETPVNPISIIPNPASDQASIHFPDAKDGSFLIELYTGLGNQISVFPCKIKGGEGNMQLSGIKPGFYLILVKSSNLLLGKAKLVIVK